MRTTHISEDNMSDKTVDKQNVGEEALNERTNERTNDYGTLPF